MSDASPDTVPLDSRLDGLLEPNPHRVQLTGPLRSLGFPDRCASCGSVTSERLPVRKVFARSAGYRRRMGSTRYRGYRIDTAQVPYCRACIARDARERQSTASRWRARLPALLIQSLPAVFPIGFAVFLLTKVGPESDEALGFVNVLSLVFGGAGAALIAYAWWDTRRCMVPRQTSVTLAFDFSPDISDLLDHSQRRIYTMRDAGFAEAFTALNKDRVWQPDPAAERAELRVWIVCGVFLAIGALVAALLNR